MKILYINTLNLNVSYFRIENMAQTLVRMGKETGDIVHVEYFVTPDSNVTFESIMYAGGENGQLIHDSLVSAFKFFDVIICQRLANKQTVDFFLELKKEHETKLYLELDDSLDRSSQSALNINAQSIININKYLALKCDGIICSTEYLANSVKKHNANTIVVPNFINQRVWQFKKSREVTDKFRIGFVAASGRDQDLHLIWPELMEYLDENKDAELVIRYGGYKPDFIDESHPQIDYKNMSCHISKYAQKFEDLNLSCSIAPLRDLEFNKCKSELKVLEAFTHNIPVVASDVVTYNNERTRPLIGQGLFLANKGEWIHRLDAARIEKVNKRLMKRIYSPTKILRKLRYWLLDELKKEIKDDTPIFQEKYEFLI